MFNLGAEHRWSTRKRNELMTLIIPMTQLDDSTGKTGNGVGHRSKPPEFKKYRRGNVCRMFQPSIRLITSGGPFNSLYAQNWTINHHIS